MKSKFEKWLHVIALKSYLLMILVNYLANALPIAGKTTSEISDSYQNLFTPAGFTFSIWGIIYLLLLVYVLFQTINYKKASYNLQKMLKKINIYFIISSLANTLWIISWHYEIIFLSLVLMIIILFSLIKINHFLRKKALISIEHYAIKIPFLVYLGWITVATIANVTIFLVSINWNQFGISEITWTNLIIFVGAIIAIISMHYYKSLSYGAVILWSYFGILAKHMSMNGFDWRYPSIVGMVIFSIVILMASEFALLRNKSNKD